MGRKARQQQSEERARPPKPAGSHVRLVERLRALVVPTVEAAGFDLIDVRVHGGRRGARHIQVFVDRWAGKGNVTIEDCASVSRKLGAMLELEDASLAECALEVSSPGINRLLRHADDMQRFAGIRARITLHERIDAPRETAIGSIEGCDEETLTLGLEDGSSREIKIEEIARATLDPTHEQWLELGRKNAAEEAHVASPETAENPRRDEEFAMARGEDR